MDFWQPPGLSTRCVEAGFLANKSAARVGRGIRSPPQVRALSRARGRRRADAAGAEGALERADHRVHRVRRPVPVATFAVRCASAAWAASRFSWGGLCVFRGRRQSPCDTKLNRPPRSSSSREDRDTTIQRRCQHFEKGTGCRNKEFALASSYGAGRSWRNGCPIVCTARSIGHITRSLATVKPMFPLPAGHAPKAATHLSGELR